VRPSLEMIAALGCFACLGLGVALDYPPLFMASALLGAASRAFRKRRM
jgi:hypothetical protein